ncbi:MAG: hypothetical protein L0Y61_04020, partial [Epsilonproteobacteria bacterium]|nr:hypothetical protein [Campylobacterota bacterium]
TYYLLDKSEWKKSPTYTKDTGGQSTYIKNTHPPTQIMYIKDTHDKDTHISLYNKPAKTSSLKGLTEKDLLKIADLYSVPVSFVKSKYDDLINYCESKGKKYRNYLATLRNFVKQDALKIRKEAINGNVKSGIDARGI